MKKEKSSGFTFKAGTKILLGEESIVLTEDSTIHFDGAEDEAKIVGLLVVSKNLDANRESLQKNYNSFGIEIPGEPISQSATTADDLQPLDENVVPSQQGVVAQVSQAAITDGAASGPKETVPSAKRPIDAVAKTTPKTRVKNAPVKAAEAKVAAEKTEEAK